MSSPSPGPSHGPHAHFPEVTPPASALTTNSARRSPVDTPYNNGRSPSGHLMPPCSPTPARRYSRDHISWMSGSQTSYHDEPGSVDHHTPRTESLLQSNSSTTVYTHLGNHPLASGTRMRQSQPDFATEIPFGNLGLDSFPRSASQVQLDSGRSEHRRGSPYSIKSSSQLSVSQKSISSRGSSGRASYREHRGPPARDHTPTPHQVAPTFGSPSSYTPRLAAPGSSAVFSPVVALPSTDDPNRPGEPTVVGHRFFPMAVDSTIRYENRNIRSSSGSNHMINKMLYQYPKTPPDVPPGWIACHHPEGALYFVHEESKTFTEMNICDPDVYEDIEYFRSFLFSELTAEIESEGLSDSLDVDEVELVLEPKTDGQGVMCCYYFVNPQARSVFWLDEWEGNDIFKDCKGVLSIPHKGLAIEAQYWYATHDCRKHWELFPNSRKITQELKDEVVDMILHAMCDHLTSDTSTCPLSVKELKNHLAVVDRINPESTGKRGHCAVIIGRIMHEFYHAYFINYYGEDCARLNFDQTVHGWRYRPSWFMTTIAPLLFMAPMNKLRLLHRISVDGTASKERWNKFLIRLHSQFQAISVLATVLLNANVALLPKQSGTGGSPQQFLGYMSLVTSMASIILGLVFTGNNRLEERIPASEVVCFLNGLRHKRHGLEILAITYSLPYVFLMWGMLLFFAAFATQWFYPSDIISQACAGAFILIVAFPIAWSIWTARGASNLWWFQKPPGEEEEPEDYEPYCGIPSSWLRFFLKFEESVTRWPIISQSLHEESHAM